MIKDEMKNRISLALKDPILQQGFEIICKENTELQDKLNNLASVAEVRLANWQKLEKENAELKNNNNVYCEGEGETLVVNVSFDKFTRINANHKMYYPYNEYNEELEKENAELKDYRLTTLAKQQTENQKYTVNLEHKLSWYDDQLTKATEIIKKLYAVYYDPCVTESDLKYRGRNKAILK